MASERVGSDLKNLITDKKCRFGDDYLTQRLFLKFAPFELVEDAIGKANVSIPECERFAFEKDENNNSTETDIEN